LRRQVRDVRSRIGTGDFDLISRSKLPLQSLPVNDRTSADSGTATPLTFAGNALRSVRIVIRLRQIVAEIKTRAAASNWLRGVSFSCAAGAMIGQKCNNCVGPNKPCGLSADGLCSDQFLCAPFASLKSWPIEVMGIR